MNFSALINHLLESYPYSYGCEWDNFGPQVGDYEKTINKILVTLDITEQVVDEAIANKVDCIISHHPLIFTPLKRVCSKGTGALCYKLIANNICALSLHTNFDGAPGGVGDRLAEILGLENISVFGEDENKELFGRIGDISPIAPKAFIENVKKALETDSVRAVISQDISARVAVVGGAGRDFIEKAALLGADTFVTADCRYHDFQKAQTLGLTLIDAGHFPTENHAILEFKRNINENFPEIEVIVSQHKNIIETL